MERYLKSQGLAADSKEGAEAVIDLINNEIREYRAKGKYGDLFPQRWIPSTMGIIDEGFTVENKMMNPTYKVVRPKVEEFYADLFDFLYTPESKNVKNVKNVEAMMKVLGDN